MNQPARKTLRRRFFVALGHAIHVTWPVLSAILAIQLALGLLSLPASRLVTAISSRGRR
jgi:hypothetical protein